jgi:NAD(P)-dependent dehydrogenase (short-subunit alcohol dehydrogenase family)
MTKTVLITGAGSGFGRQAAIALAARGHRVIAATETLAQAEALGAEAPELEMVKIDITTDDVDVVGHYDLDVLINNAGVGETGPLADVPLARVRRLFEVNVFGTLNITQRAVPAMAKKGSGRIMIMSSIAGVMAAPTFGPYAMTKHALEAMGKALRAELAPKGIDVTLVNPGPYATGFNDRMADSMWEWFGEGALGHSESELFKMIGGFVTGSQMDPVEVSERLVELVEAETTSENNFVPAGLEEQLRAARP